MSENNDLKDVEQGAFRDTMRDGLTEMVAGTFFVLSPIMFYEPVFIIYFSVLYVIFLPQITEGARKRFTYPRIGYVKVQIKESDFNLKGLVGIIAIVLLGTSIATFLLTNDIYNHINWITVLPFSVGLLMLGPSDYLVEKSGTKIYWLFGIATSILGLVVTYLTILIPPQSPYEGLVGFSMLLGVGLFIIGVVTFLRFIRTNPVIAHQEDEGIDQ